MTSKVRAKDTKARGVSEAEDVKSFLASLVHPAKREILMTSRAGSA